MTFLHSFLVAEKFLGTVNSLFEELQNRSVTELVKLYPRSGIDEFVLNNQLSSAISFLQSLGEKASSPTICETLESEMIESSSKGL